jgi:5-methylcytosine-specific restriction endonuclease McrA
MGAIAEPYSLDEIAQRDRRCCGLCGQRVAMTRKTPHPRAPVIDHLVPLSKGGDDTKANVWLAHYVCNARKGARPAGEQLALL